MSPNTPTPNLSFTRFVFIVPRREDEAFLTRLKMAGAAVARGFFNDFDADAVRDNQSLETIQFLVAETDLHPDSAITAARFVVQVTGKYRPRLLDVELDLRKRLSDSAAFVSVEGAVRAPRYTSPELHEYAFRPAATRRPGRQSPCAVVLPISKTDDWWSRPTLERHAFFYPHIDSRSGCLVPGHAQAAEEGIATIYRRLFHNPNGYQRAGEYDFLTYFEFASEQSGTFQRVHRALQDVANNPEWRFVLEGPLWRGKRVLKW